MRIAPSYKTGYASPSSPWWDQAAYPDLWRGCVGAWSMGLGATGTSVFDNSVYGKDGTLSAALSPTAWGTYAGQPSLDFDGPAQDEYVNVGDHSHLSFSNGSTDSPFSIYARVRVDSNAGTSAIVTKYKDLSVMEWYFSISSAGKLICQILDDSAIIRCRRDSDAALSLNQWYDVAFTYDASGVDEAIILFVDGLPIASTGLGQDGSYVAMTPGSSDVRIGQGLYDEALYDGYMHGQISEVRIYNRVLDPSEIKLLAKRPGIAYEREEQVFAKAPAAAGNRRRRLLIGSV